MRKVYKSREEIDIPKDSNGNYIVDDPDMFDSTYETWIHGPGSTFYTDKKIMKERRIFVNMTVYVFKCKSCGKWQTRSFRNAHIEDHKTLLCQECLNIKKRGYAYTYQNPEKQKYALDRMVEKHGGFGTAVPEIKAKVEDTNIKKYGFACSLKNKEVDAVARANTRKTLGVDYPTQSAAFREKMADRLEEKTGHRYALQNPKSVSLYKENFTEKHGVDNPMKLSEIQQKSIENRVQKYLRRGIQFDSKWELAYWIYVTEGLKDNRIKRLNDFYYEFTVPGDPKVHRYYPDFEYLGNILEIKGTHFYEDRDVNSRMINPFFREADDLFEAKRKCAIEHGVKFVPVEEIEKAIQYVKDTYGNGYLDIWGIDKNSFPYPEPRFDRDMTLQTYFENLIKKYHRSIYHAKVAGCKYSPYEAWFDKEFVDNIAKNRAIYSEYSDKLSPKSILHGFSVTKRATKVSVFSVASAHDLIQKYLNDVTTIFDPFSGFSGRMLGAILSGKVYYGQDLNLDHVFESNCILRELVNSKYLIKFYSQVINKDIFTSSGCYESLFTCPPYKNKEDWNNENQVSLSCDEWIDECLKRFKCKKYLFVVDDTVKYKDYVVETIENKSHFGTNSEKIILIDKTKTLNCDLQYTYPYIILPIPLTYWATVPTGIWHNYQGKGVTPFDIEPGSKYVKGNNGGVTPFDLVKK